MKDGGPAFPCLEGGYEYLGMSLREYAVIEFTKAWIQVFGDRHRLDGYADDAANAYALKHGTDQADAFMGWREEMLAERRK